MSMILETGPLLVAVISVIASTASTLISVLKKKSEIEKKKEEIEKIKSKAAQISVDLGVVKFTKNLEREFEEIPQSEILAQLESRIIDRLKDTGGASEESIREVIQEDLNEFRRRIEKIENRFPEESKIEKISSINDALLSERIDQLKEHIDKLEGRILSKWDVALTVSSILAGISAVVAATYGIIKFIESGGAS